MALNLIVDSLDDLPEDVKGHYTADGDKFKLDVDGLENVDGLKSALEKERDANRNHSKLIKEFQALGNTPADIQKQIELLKEVDPKDVDVSESREYKLKIQELEKVTVERDTAVSAMQAAQGATKKTIADMFIGTALAKAEAMPNFQDLLTAQLRQHVQIEIGEDGNVKTTITNSDGETPMIGTADDGSATMEDLINKVAKENWPEAFKGDLPGGGGKRPGSGGAGGAGNRKYEDFSPAELSKLNRENPAEYQRLLASAEHKKKK